MLVAIALLLSTGVAEGRSLRLIIDHRTVDLTEYQVGDERYVALPELLDAFGAASEWDAASQALRSRLNGHDWVFWAGSAIVSIDDEARTLGLPVLLREGEPAAPLSAIVQLLGYYTSEEFRFQGPDLRVEDVGGAVLGYRIDTRRNGVVIELSMSDVIRHQTFVSEGNWINLTFNRARLQPRRLNSWRPHPAVREVRASQFETSAQLSFQMKNPVDKYMITTDDALKTITVLVGDTSFVLNASAVQPPPLESEGVYNPVDVVAIDAGHGGADFGAAGIDDVVLEKDITLAIAERLAHMFEKDGDFTVVMTRDDDRIVSLGERAAIANGAVADLFISIHANATDKSDARGCQTFFAGQSLSEDARLLAAFENSTVSFGMSEASSDSAAAENGRKGYDYQSASADLANRIQGQFEAELDVPSRGVDQAEFAILDLVDAPGVMVFAAFLTNEQDEESLRRRSFQKKVAEAIYDAVVMYRDKREQAQAARLDQ
jgi:N-acetylmuramoyl-L-alanine amidase